MAKLNSETFTDYEFNGEISNYVAYLFEHFSVNPFPSEVKIPNDAWIPFIQLLYKGNNQHEPTYIYDNSLLTTVYPEIPLSNNVLVAFSGGKDSTANMLYLKDTGWDVTCIFTKGANRSANKEIDHAIDIANMYNVPLITDQIHITGKTDFFENPVKNILIVSRIIEYGLKHNCLNISVGFTHDILTSELTIMYNYSDSKELMTLFENALKKNVSSLRIDWLFKEEATDLSYLVYYHSEVIPSILSCLMPERYKKSQLKFTSKYHLHADIANPDIEGVMPGRCMNCWKCMAEWAYLYCWNKLPYNKEYFEQKILPTFLKKIDQLDNTLTGRTDLTTHDLLDAAIEIDVLSKYVKNPNLILLDIYHAHTELDKLDDRSIFNGQKN